MTLREELFAAIDVDLFLTYIDDDWIERFRYVEDGYYCTNTEMAFDFYTKYMKGEEFMAAIKESGCRL